MQKFEDAYYQAAFVTESADGLDIKPVVTYNRYRDQFNATGLRFGKLATDSCATCDRLVCLIKQADDEGEKGALQRQHRQHLKEADIS